MSTYIIFIPGLTGSVLKHGRDTIWPPKTTEFIFGIKKDNYRKLKYSQLRPDNIIYDTEVFGIPYCSIYRFIITELQKEYGTNVVKVFPYDWRKSVEETTEELFLYLKSLFNAKYNNHFYLIGHSLGGLVATNILKYKHDELIQKSLIGICTIASPLLGSFEAFVYLYLLKSKNKYYGNLLSKEKMHVLTVTYQSIYDLVPYDTIAERTIIGNEAHKSVMEFLFAMQTFMGGKMKTLPDINKLIKGYKFNVNFKKRLFDFNHNSTRMNIYISAKRQLEVVDLRHSKSDENIVYWYDYNTSGDGVVNHTSPERLTVSDFNDVDENVHTSICRNGFVVNTIKNEINRSTRCFFDGKCLFTKLRNNLFPQLIKHYQHSTNIYFLEIESYASSIKFNQHIMLKTCFKIRFTTREWYLKAVTCFDEKYKRLLSSYDNILEKNLNITSVEFYYFINSTNTSVKLYLEIQNSFNENSSTDIIDIK